MITIVHASPTHVSQCGKPLFVQARALALTGGAGLLSEARRRTQNWHAPCPELLHSSSAHDVTGYPVFDRWIRGVRSWSIGGLGTILLVCVCVYERMRMCLLVCVQSPTRGGPVCAGPRRPHW
jgi:hypothetical protein